MQPARASCKQQRKLEHKAVQPAQALKAHAGAADWMLQRPRTHDGPAVALVLEVQRPPARDADVAAVHRQAATTAATLPASPAPAPASSLLPLLPLLLAATG